MSNPSNPDDESKTLRDQIIGLGERSLRKSYFPQLQHQIEELRHAKDVEAKNAKDLREMLIELESMRQRAAESEANYREIFRYSSEAIIVHDIQTKRVYEVNRAFEELYGYTQAEAEQISISDLSAQTEEACESRAQLLVQTAIDKGVCRFEWPARRKDGTTFWADVTLKSASIRGMPRLLATVRDITERKQIEASLAEAHRSLEEKVAMRTLELQQANQAQALLLERLQNTQAQLVQSEKLAALGALVSGIAHELGTPIGNAVMVASTIEELRANLARELAAGTLRKSSLAEFFEALGSGSMTMLRNMQRAAELVESFKEVAIDRTSTRRRKFDLLEMVHETEVALAPSVRHSGCHFDIGIPGGIVLDSFPGPLGQVLGNLVANAIMHGYEGSSGGRISICARDNDSSVTIEVADAGSGIREDHLMKIFDPFFTTKLGRGGSGLGLHIVYNIVTGILGGTINARSTPGQGAVFTLTIPKVAPPCVDG